MRSGRFCHRKAKHIPSHLVRKGGIFVHRVSFAYSAYSVQPHNGSPFGRAARVGRFVPNKLLPEYQLVRSSAFSRRKRLGRSVTTAATAILKHLERLVLHRIFVLGFCKKRRCVRSEQTMSMLEGIGPIDLILDDHRFTCSEGFWTTGPEVPQFSRAIQTEITELRHQKRRLKKELEKYTKRSQEMDDLREKLNLLDFKYQLLLDMWTTRMADERAASPGDGFEPPPAEIEQTVRNITTTTVEETTVIQ